MHEIPQMSSEKIIPWDGPSGYKASLNSLYQFLSDVGCLNIVS